MGEFEKYVADYFTGAELVDLLDIPMEELVSLLSEYIDEKREEISEYISYGE